MLYSNMHIETPEAESLPKIIVTFERTDYQGLEKDFSIFSFLFLKHSIFKCPTHYCVVNNLQPLQYSCLENPMDEGAW